MRLCHNLNHVRALLIVATEADHRGILRDCRLARRVVATLQHCSNPAHSGDPPISQRTCPAAFIDEVESDSELGKGCCCCDGHDKREIGNSRYEASFTRSALRFRGGLTFWGRSAFRASVAACLPMPIPAVRQRASIRGEFLLRQFGPEVLLLLRDILLVAIRIDEGVGVPLLHQRVLRFEAEVIAVSTKENVAWQ